MERPEANTEIDSSQRGKQTPVPLVDDEHSETTRADTSGATASSLAFFPVSEGKLITLYILSFGLYGVYWFYKNWKLQQPAMDKKIYPVWRAIFSIFFTHSLFKRIDQQASHLKKEHKFNASLLATIFVITIIASNVLDRLVGVALVPESVPGQTSNNTIFVISLALFVISVVPMVKAQATINRINNDMLGYLNHKYSLANYLLIALGSIAWLMVVLGLVFNYMGISTVE